MRSWGLAIGMMGPKFWKLYRKEGLMRAILRGKPYRPTHEKAGFGDELAPLVGVDEYGNRYYEDFNHKNKNQRRFVEFADTGRWFPTPKKISPAWHGWMHHQYDDPPKVKQRCFNFCAERQLRGSLLPLALNPSVQDRSPGWLLQPGPSAEPA